MGSGEVHDGRGAFRRLLRNLRRSATGALAVAAILLTVWEGLENRRHNRLSVQPRVDGGTVVTREDGRWTQVFRFSSDGLGPAEVTEFQVYWKGDKVQDGREKADGSTGWQPVLNALADRFQTTALSLAVGSVLRVDEDYDVLTVVQSSGANVTDLLDATSSLAVLLCYCSLYGDQCRGTTIGTSSLDVSSCNDGGRLDEADTRQQASR